ncbi:hypothetical protein BCLUESOX_340 [bacterium endosymbiont of Bathymodiolus sp. 5 South]|nr:hypothetical protein BCLUESOX_340 [bacterium endosymbiont of Bathymodiolus sp. 5 South]
MLSISDQREGGVYNRADENKPKKRSISDQREGGVYNRGFRGLKKQIKYIRPERGRGL